jgi:hypothetical protein
VGHFGEKTMKKLLLVTTALAGVAMMSAPASAAVKLDLGGFFRGYGVYTDNNEAAGDTSSLYKFEFRRDTEIQANGETTLDNGLTIGAHSELKLANGSNSVLSDEEYAYASGGWGRFNLGVEDGAAYLLQVNAPSADSNIDGMRVNIQALNPISKQSDVLGGIVGSSIVDYAHSDFRSTERLTYMTPKFNGFQGGISYAPKNDISGNKSGMSNDAGLTAFDPTRWVAYDSAGNNVYGLTYSNYKNLWELAGRWDGEYQGYALAFGAGYSSAAPEQKATADLLDSGISHDLYNFDHPGSFGISDSLKTWNIGGSIAAQGFSLGGSYKKTDTSYISDAEWSSSSTDEHGGDISGKTWVIGAGYDTGAYHVGASYLNNNIKMDGFTGGADWSMPYSEFETNKATIGGGYTFGPGMTFRGAVAWGTFDNKSDGATAADDNDFTQVSVGTDIQF